MQSATFQHPIGLFSQQSALDIVINFLSSFPPR